MFDGFFRETENVLRTQMRSGLSLNSCLWDLSLWHCLSLPPRTTVAQSPVCWSL